MPLLWPYNTLLYHIYRPLTLAHTRVRPFIITVHGLLRIVDLSGSGIDLYHHHMRTLVHVPRYLARVTLPSSILPFALFSVSVQTKLHRICSEMRCGPNGQIEIDRRNLLGQRQPYQSHTNSQPGRGSFMEKKGPDWMGCCCDCTLLTGKVSIRRQDIASMSRIFSISSAFFLSAQQLCLFDLEYNVSAPCPGLMDGRT